MEYDLLEPFVDALSIDYSTQCNLRCKYCHTGSTTFKNIDSSEAMRQKIHDFCLQTDMFNVWLSTSGETTMYPDWHEKLSLFLDDPRFDLHMNSNFARVFSDADLLALNKIGDLQISIDSSSPELMKSQRTADLRTIIANVVRLRQTMMETGKNTHLRFNCTVTRANITHIGGLARLALLLQIEALHVTEVMETSDNPNMPGLLEELTDDEARQFALSVMDAARTLDGTSTRLEVRHGLLTKLRPIMEAIETGGPVSAASLRAADNKDLNIGPCEQPWKTLIVMASGDVHTCCGQTRVVGNINDQDLIDIANGPIARELRKEMLDRKPGLPCETCSMAQPSTIDAFWYRIASLHHRHDEKRAAAGIPIRPRAAAART